MKYLDWVDAYLAGELPEAQQKEFEAALYDSAALQDEVALTSKMLAALALGVPDETIATIVGQTAERHRSERDSLFQQYRANTLPPAERIQFEKRLAEDELLTFEWEMYQKAHPVLKDKKVRMIWARWAAAASVALVLGAIAWWTFQNTNRQSEELFARYDVPELFPQAEYALVNEGVQHKGMIGSDSFSELKIKGLKAYEAKDWDTAIRLLSEYVSRAKPSEEELLDEINFVNLYIGRAWLEKGEPAKAVSILQKADAGVTDLDNYALRRELIRWHLALAHLKNRDPAAAKTVLQSLQQAQHETIRQQATNLLNDLK